jgi:hypothetical protein
MSREVTQILFLLSLFFSAGYLYSGDFDTGKGESGKTINPAKRPQMKKNKKL